MPDTSFNNDLPDVFKQHATDLAKGAFNTIRTMGLDPDNANNAMLNYADTIAAAAGRPRTNWSKAGDMLGSEGTGTAIRGLGGAGIGYMLGNALGGNGLLGATLGGVAGLTPEIAEHAPKLLEAVKGLFSKNAAALQAVEEGSTEKSASLIPVINSYIHAAKPKETSRLAGFSNGVGGVAGGALGGTAGAALGGLLPFLLGGSEEGVAAGALTGGLAGLLGGGWVGSKTLGKELLHMHNKSKENELMAAEAAEDEKKKEQEKSASALALRLLADPLTLGSVTGAVHPEMSALGGAARAGGIATGAGLGSSLGALLGGGLGAGVGALTGVDPKSYAVVGALLGSLPGGVIGGVKGHKWAKNMLKEHAKLPDDHPAKEKEESQSEKKASLLGAAALLAANKMGKQRSVDVNGISVPEGALPPEELLLPEVKREGRKATVKSILKNLSLGALGGAGLGALGGALSADERIRREAAIAGALLGGALGTGGGVLSSIWNTPDARLEAMKEKHKELHGIA